jgi:hypothetical protein
MHNPLRQKTLQEVPGLLTFVITVPVLWAIVTLIGFAARWIAPNHALFNYPFFPDKSYTDFTIFRPEFEAFRTPQFWQPKWFPFTYPAPSALAFEAFFAIPYHHLLYFLLFIVASAIVAAIVAFIALRRHGLTFTSALVLVGVALIGSYPIMFLFDRGNIEIVNWIFVSLAVAAIWRERWTIAGVFLGVAISLKIFPVVLLGLFLARKKFLPMAIAIGTAVTLDITSLAIVGPTIRIAHHHISEGLKYFQYTYVDGFRPLEIRFDHSLFAIVKHIASIFGFADATHLATLARWYIGIVAVAALAIYFGRIVKLPRVNQILIMLAISVLIPPVSGDYTLVHLYAGWLILALYALEAEPGVIRSRVLPICFFLLAIAFCPETYMTIANVYFAGSFKALALVALVALLLIYPLEEKRSMPDKAIACSET